MSDNNQPDSLFGPDGQKLWPETEEDSELIQSIDDVYNRILQGRADPEQVIKVAAVIEKYRQEKHFACMRIKTEVRRLTKDEC